MADRVLLFAHGAGAGSTSAWMQAWSQRLAVFGTVTTFDYPYRTRGSRRPDPLPVLIAAHRQALNALTKGRRAPTVLIGKSMGSRIGCHVALEEQVDHLICLGYPLVSPGGRGAVRDEVLKALDTPVLFVSGSRDPLCPLELLDSVRRQMTAPSELHVVAGGNHSLEVTRRELGATGRTQADVDAAVLESITRFIGD